ncbi:hypothetical protein CC1G_13579 [Coprinopsis cinerea okayama7|uniref:Uncharacterized protein n=1 Tax=Coprinopsis cinerea (strain Okayama-7 / 130 / ATCC MYA-4618 / FGSC 9003) TaxID=240176 RepID=D6RJS1_COPC7|nr:hypothetical protein CC1G_13579 [Coprinopsis cinerea okayama7\|eukprot:XP_002912051.1 hypothetical protein CC1G_13579 [Coprinopsis cinerea okayama7\
MPRPINPNSATTFPRGRAATKLAEPALIAIIAPLQRPPPTFTPSDAQSAVSPPGLSLCIQLNGWHNLFSSFFSLLVSYNHDDDGFTQQQFEQIPNWPTSTFAPPTFLNQPISATIRI